MHFGKLRFADITLSWRFQFQLFFDVPNRAKPIILEPQKHSLPEPNEFQFLCEPFGLSFPVCVWLLLFRLFFSLPIRLYQDVKIVLLL